MNGKGKRDQILLAYAWSTDPAEKQRLLKQWLDAGGRQVIDDAVHAGLSTLKTGQARG